MTAHRKIFSLEVLNVSDLFRHYLVYIKLTIINELVELVDHLAYVMEAIQKFAISKLKISCTFHFSTHGEALRANDATLRAACPQHSWYVGAEIAQKGGAKGHNLVYFYIPRHKIFKTTLWTKHRCVVPEVVDIDDITRHVAERCN